MQRLGATHAAFCLHGETSADGAGGNSAKEKSFSALCSGTDEDFLSLCAVRLHLGDLGCNEGEVNSSKNMLRALCSSGRSRFVGKASLLILFLCLRTVQN